MTIYGESIAPIRAVMEATPMAVFLKQKTSKIPKV